MKFCVNGDPEAREFDSAEQALRFATGLVYLKPALFGTYLDRLNRGLPVTWVYGFKDLSVRPVRVPWAPK